MSILCKLGIHNFVYVRFQEKTFYTKVKQKCCKDCGYMQINTKLIEKYLK